MTAISEMVTSLQNMVTRQFDVFNPVVVSVGSLHAGSIGETFGPDRHETLANPLTGSEDFSRVLQTVPGSFVGLGAVPADRDPAWAAFNHSPQAQYDDAVLADGAALYAELALSRARTGTSRA